jgi:lipopolysaccharide/colanic/teichoic acid biosynthesis glycosyltransferase
MSKPDNAAAIPAPAVSLAPVIHGAENPACAARRNLRILLIHQAFASPAEGGGTRHFEFAQKALASGHTFTVVASDLSYLSGTRLAERRGLYAEQYINGLHVFRAYAHPALHRGFVWRVFSFCTFVGSSFLTALSTGPVDLVVGTSPPIFQAFSAWAVAFLRRRPFLLEIRDLWPEFAIDMGVLTNPALIWFSRRLERFLYTHAAHIVVNSPAYRDYLVAHQVAPLSISLIPNGVDPTMFDPESTGETSRQRWALRNTFVLCYAGAIGMANDLLTVIRTAERLREEQDIVFLIAGDGKERPNLEAESARLRLENVIFTGQLSKSDVADVMAASDACIAILKDIPMFRTTYPNKVFDYMAAGRATVLAIDGVIRRVIEDSGSGIFVRPGDEADLADAILRLARNRPAVREMGLRGRQYVVRHFNRNDQAAEFVTLCENLVAHWNEEPHPFYRRTAKRIFDLVLTVPLTLVLIPAFVVITALVKLSSPGPVFFNQRRLGKSGNVFRAYKFRTMVHRERTRHVEVRSGNPEVTTVGEFLRRFKLDELPQLLNVLKGDMSLVGPRPPLPEQMAEYDNETMKRLEVRPGLTGLAQIHGGTQMSWPQRWQYDLQYVRELSFPLDLRILSRTILVVALGESRFHTPPSAEER